MSAFIRAATPDPNPFGEDPPVVPSKHCGVPGCHALASIRKEHLDRIYGGPRGVEGLRARARMERNDPGRVPSEWAARLERSTRELAAAKRRR